MKMASAHNLSDVACDMCHYFQVSYSNTELDSCSNEPESPPKSCRRLTVITSQGPSGRMYRFLHASLLAPCLYSFCFSG